MKLRIIKKLLVITSFTLLALSPIQNNVFATSTTSSISAPRTVGTYFDFTNQIRLTWNSVSGAASYNVYVNGNKVGFVLRPVNFTPKITYYVGPVTAVGKYMIQVKSVDCKGIESTTSASSIVWVRSLHIPTPAPAPVPIPTPVIVQPSPTSVVSMAQPVASIGTYNDFGQAIRLQWKPTVGSTNGYNVYLAPGYNANTGFVLQHHLTTYSLVRNSGMQWVIQDGVITPTMGWYTVMVTGVDANGIESTPCYASVLIMR